MILSLPSEVTREIANRAVQIARQDIELRGWRSSAALVPVSGEGTVGIRSEIKYLMYQNNGIKPFVMWNLEGKLIPIKGADGSVRMIRVRGVGQPGFVNIPGRGRIWRDQKWRHPGLQPKHFMQSAIRRAANESMPEIKSYFFGQLNAVRRGELTQ